MNISTGGPHLLLFERDQQLTTLLISEFQLAGYECHVARTAVEVFDAIARYPIRLVLVNLAQAAAARREFWIALDTQRRGRGVQVMTFQCTHIAGYGSHDPDDRTYAIADVHVDGMLGVMNLVDAVRTRIPPIGISNTLPPIGRTPPPTSPAPSSSPSGFQSSAQAMNPASLSGTSVPHGGTTAETRTVRSNLVAFSPSSSQTGTALQPQSPPSLPPLPPVAEATVDTGVGRAGQGPQSGQSYTDKIRAVLYPNQRSRVGQSSASSGQEAERASYEVSASPMHPVSSSQASALQHLANGQDAVNKDTDNDESSLAQLSKLVQASHPSASSEPYANSPHQPQSSSVPADTASHPAFGVYHAKNTNASPDATAPSPGYSAQVSEQISMQPLRASPIQDLPFERGERSTTAVSPAGTDEIHRHDGSPYTNYGQPPAAQPSAAVHLPLASIATAIPAPAQEIPQAQPIVQEQTESRQVPVMPALTPVSAQAASVAQQEETKKQEEPNVPAQAREQVQQQGQQSAASTEPVVEEAEEPDIAYEQVELSTEEEATKLKMEDAPQNALLLDIVQSLPPMSSPPPQQQVLSGRATRSLGSVLLEGHLVPQNRLEVAQSIQRMLRGVDLNYQLGEILLMFKLLTPDQLLAASLVSYGLITTQQIAALGHIRQELHSIGLEYDLENLLILFRILTPEQLREVRSSWQG
jgi:hypothetical protein